MFPKRDINEMKYKSNLRIRICVNPISRIRNLITELSALERSVNGSALKASMQTHTRFSNLHLK